MPVFLRLSLVAWCLLSPAALAQSSLLREGLTVPEGAVAILDGQTISQATFVDYLCTMFARSGGNGEDVVAALIDEALVTARMRELGIKVTDAEVEDKYREYDRQVRASMNKSLSEKLVQEGVNADVFRRGLRQVAGLEKILPIDLKLPAGPIKDENLKMKLWLTNRRQTAVTVRDPATLPPDTLLMVNGEPVTKLDFARRFLMREKPETIRLALDTLLQEVLVDRLLAQFGLRLTPEVLMQEWQLRKEEFENTPRYKGLKYEDVVKQQTSWDPDRYRKSRGFKVHAGVGYIGRTQFGEDRIREAYERFKDRFGPKLTLAHIYIRATDRARFRGSMPTFDEARQTAKRIIEEIKSGKRFEDLVTLYSEDPTSKFREGRLPTVTPGNHNLDQALVDAALGLAEGRVCDDPIRSRIGYHVVKLAGREPAPPLSAVEETVRRMLAEEDFKHRFEALKPKLGIDVRRL